MLHLDLMKESSYRVGDILLALEKIDQETLDQGLKRQKQTGATLGEELIRMGAISDESLLDALSRKTQVPYVNLVDNPIPVEMQSRIKFETVQKRRILPIMMDDKVLIIGMLDPTDTEAISEAEFECGADVRPALLSADQFHRALDFFDQYGYGKETMHLDMRSELHPEMDLPTMLRILVAWKGQDLHLSAHAVPAIRVDNEMRRLNLPIASGEDVRRMVNELLTEEQRQVLTEKRQVDFAHTAEGVGRFRCNAYHQKESVSLTARHVSSRIPSMRELHLPDFMRDIALKKQGLVLVVGPNGHGKTTTLASLIDVINHERNANVITIEDPIEYLHQHHRSNVNQREVGTDTRSFAEGLRAVFRQNPDVIVIGEMRDPESISIALSAAETGHLVLASMHALNSTAAVDRILDVFPGDQQQQIRTQLAESLLAIFSQRLLRRKSGHGRAMAWEKVENSIRVSRAIREGRGHSLRQLMQSNLPELVPMERNLAVLVKSGEVALEEAQKWAADPDYLESLAGG